MRLGMVKVRIVRFASTIGSVAVLASPATAGATVLDFEEFSPPANLVTNFSSSLSSQGFDFSASSGDILIAGNGQPNVPNTGSNTLVMNAGRPSVVTLTTASGAPFTLNSLLAIEGRNTNTGFFVFSAHDIDVLGTFAAGGTISTTLDLDLFAQENNTLDAELFSFVGWTALSSVRFTGVGGGQNGWSYGFDNITLNQATVPEPAAALLLGVALAAMGAARGRPRA